MSELLRPSSLGEILDRTASLYRARFSVYFGIACIPAAVVLGFGGLALLLVAWGGTGSAQISPVVFGGILLLGVVGLPLLTAANALSGAALCQAASTHAMGGAISIRAAFRMVQPRAWLYVGLYLLLALIIFVAPFIVWTVLVTAFAAVAAVAGAKGASVAAGGSMLLLFIAVAVYVVWMLLQLALAFPASVVEHAGVGASLKRAWDLSKGTRLRILVLFVLGMAIGWIASLTVVVPMTVAMALVPALNSPQHAQIAQTLLMIAMYGASFLVQSLTWPIYAIALVLFYYDQRVRQEGFDIELLMRVAGMETGLPAPLLAPAQTISPDHSSAVSIGPASSSDSTSDQRPAGETSADAAHDVGMMEGLG